MARLEGTAGQSDDRVKLLIRRIIAYLVLILLVFISLFPFWLLFVNSTRGSVQTGVRFYPEGYLLSNLKYLFSESFTLQFGNIVRSFGNSIFIALFATVLSVYFSALTAYAVHVYDFKLKRVVHTFILIIMMFPTQATALGLYRMLNSMGLLDSYIPLIIPSIAAPAVYFFMIQYMASSLPLDIVEAARIDGCGEFRTFNTIVLPIMKPAIAVQAIFQVVASWNNLFNPQLILQTEEKSTIPMVIQSMKYTMETTPQFNAGGAVNLYTILAILPVVIIYLCLSKNIVSGVALGSVKG